MEDKGKGKIVAVSAVVIALIAGVVGLKFFFSGGGADILEKAFNKLEKVNSLVLTYRAPKQDVDNLKLVVHNDKKDADIRINIPQIDKNVPNSHFKLNLIIKENKYFYLQADIAQKQLVDEWLKGGLNNFASSFIGVENPNPAELTTLLDYVHKTQTYTTTIKLLTSQGWLVIENTESGKDKKVNPSPSGVVLSSPFIKQLKKAVKINTVEKNVDYKGGKYTLVKVGFKKDELIKAVEELKREDINMKVSDINRLAEVVRNIEGWEKDLLSFYINAEGELSYANVRTPGISKEFIRKQLEERAKEENTPVQVTSEQIDDIYKGFNIDKNGSISLGEIAFSNYNSAPAVNAPAAGNKIKIEEYMGLAQQEIKQMMIELTNPNIQRAN